VSEGVRERGIVEEWIVGYVWMLLMWGVRECVSEGVGRDEVRGRRGCLEGSLEEHVK
jgi:hypothetical protein